MSVLIFADNSEGKFKKTAYEIVSYGKQVAQQAGTSAVVLTINADDTSVLSDYGADKILKIKDSRLDNFNARAFADCIQQAAEQEDADIIVVDSTTNGLYLAPLLAVKLNAGYTSNVVALPVSMSPFTVKRNAFSSKGFNISQINTENKLLGLAKNSFGLKEQKVASEIIEFSRDCKFSDCSHTNEKGCAILNAIDEGDLSEQRFKSYIKMKKESEFNEMSYFDKRKKDKDFGKLINSAVKNKNR